jgi:peptide deformylase
MKENDVFKLENIRNITVLDGPHTYVDVLNAEPSIMTPIEILGTTWVVAGLTDTPDTEPYVLARSLEGYEWAFFGLDEKESCYGLPRLVDLSMPLIPGDDKRLCHPVRGVNEHLGNDVESLDQLITDLFATLHRYGGLGLAANQLGCNRRVFVMDVGMFPRIFIDPVLESEEGEQTTSEGCLTFPGESVVIKRAAKVTISGVTLEGLEAVVAQHELDHLNGKTILDYA